LVSIRHFFPVFIIPTPVSIIENIAISVGIGIINPGLLKQSGITKFTLLRVFYFKHREKKLKSTL